MENAVAVMNLSLGKSMHDHNSPSLFSITQRAREMRKAPTRSEQLLWRRVCGKQLGVRVRRQHPLHPFIADFFVASYKLVIEIDGGIHAEQRERDAHRDRELSRLYDVRVLRITSELVERDINAALDIICAALI